MKTFELSTANKTLVVYLRQKNNLPLILTSRGKPVAAVIDVSGLDVESIVVGNSPTFQRIIRKSRDSLHKHGGITIDEMRRRLGLAPQKARNSISRRKNTPRK